MTIKKYEFTVDDIPVKIYPLSELEYDKEKILVVCSFTEKTKNWSVPAGFDLASAELLISNYDKLDGTTLKPYETRVYRWKK